MKVTYLFHDCFLIEFRDCLILTDWFESVPAEVVSKIAEKLKPVYVLVSHHHKDHFSPRIFSWHNKFPDVHYIISRDTYRKIKYLLNPDSGYRGTNRIDAGHVTVLHHEEVYRDANILVKAYGSTDIGNSYVVECERMRIYFAGDNNAWIWRGESAKEEIDDMLARYKTTLDRIADDYTCFDLALIPADPRMGSDIKAGAETFCNKFGISSLIPMHFELWSNEEEKMSFHEAVGHIEIKCKHYIPLSEPGQSVVL